MLLMINEQRDSPQFGEYFMMREVGMKTRDGVIPSIYNNHHDDITTVFQILPDECDCCFSSTRNCSKFILSALAGFSVM